MGYNDGLGWSDYLAAGLTALHPAFGAGYQMLDNAQAGQDLKRIDNATDYNTLQQILQQSPVSTASNYDALHRAALARKSIIDTAGAQPVVDILSQMGAEGNSYDPNFSGKEWVEGMMTTPALGGKLTSQQYGALRGPQGINGNPLIPQALQGAELQAQKMGNLYRAADDVNSDRFNPGTITEFLSPTGLGALTTGDKGTGGASLADKLISLKKQSEEGQNSANLQKFLNAVGAGNLADSPALNAIYAAAPRGIKASDIETITKNTNIAPTVSYHDIGGPGNTVQLAGFDSRGKQVGTFGLPTDKRPVSVVRVSPELPTQTAMKTFGERTINDLAKGAEEMRKLATENENWVEMKVLASRNPNTGFGADTRMKAQKIYQWATGKDPAGLTDAQVMNGLNTVIAGKAARQGDSNPTQQQIENYRKAYPGISTTQAANLYMLDKVTASNSRQIREHNERAAKIATWPGAEGFGAITAEQHTVKDPAAQGASPVKEYAIGTKASNPKTGKTVTYRGKGVWK